MSNVIHRIFRNAMLFTLFMSVSLTVLAHDFHDKTTVYIPTAHYVACDVPDQANLDVDIDLHDNNSDFRVLQPLPEAALSQYVKPKLTASFKRAPVRGPPAYII